MNARALQQQQQQQQHEKLQLQQRQQHERNVVGAAGENFIYWKTN